MGTSHTRDFYDLHDWTRAMDRAEAVTLIDQIRQLGPPLRPDIEWSRYAHPVHTPDLLWEPMLAVIEAATNRPGRFCGCCRWQDAHAQQCPVPALERAVAEQGAGE